MKIYAAFIVIMTAALISAQAQTMPKFSGFTSGNQLYEMCSDDDSAPEKVACLAYVEGATDQWIVADDLLHQKSMDSVCLPFNATVVQIKDVVMKYMRDNPADRNGRAASLIAGALLMAYPCKK